MCACKQGAQTPKVYITTRKHATPLKSSFVSNQLPNKKGRCCSGRVRDGLPACQKSGSAKASLPRPLNGQSVAMVAGDADGQSFDQCLVPTGAYPKSCEESTSGRTYPQLGLRLLSFIKIVAHRVVTSPSK